MPVKSLITFKKQRLRQLGIDPAFEEAALERPARLRRTPAMKKCVWCSPAPEQRLEDDPGQEVEQPAHRARCATNLQSEI